MRDGGAWAERRSQSPPMTLPDSVRTLSPSRQTHQVYAKAADDLDSLLALALDDFARRDGSLLQDARRTPSSAGSASFSLTESVTKFRALDDADDIASTSRHERHRSLLSFHRWTALLMFVDPQFCTARRMPQIESWALSSAFAAWALAVAGGNRAQAQPKQRLSRPTTPVERPAEAAQLPLAFGAWAGEARASAQERVEATSDAFGRWCVYAKSAKRMRQLNMAARMIARGRLMLLARQVLLKWGAVAALNRRPEPEPEPEPEPVPQEDDGWLQSARQRLRRVPAVPADDDDDTAAAIPSAELCRGRSALPRQASLEDGEIYESPEKKKQALAKLEQPTPPPAPAQPAVPALSPTEIADRHYAMRLKVKVAFCFAFWQQMLGGLRSPPAVPKAATAAPAVAAAPVAAAVEPTPPKKSTQQQKKAKADDPEEWLMRRAGFMDGVLSSDDESEDGESLEEGEVRETAEEKRLALAELACGLLQGGGGNDGEEGGHAPETNDEEVVVMAADELLGSQVEVEVEVEPAAEEESPASDAQEEVPEVQEQEQEDDKLDKLQAAAAVHAAADVPKAAAAQPQEYGWAAHLSEWAEWYFFGEFWKDADAKAARGLRSAADAAAALAQRLERQGLGEPAAAGLRPSRESLEVAAVAGLSTAVYLALRFRPAAPQA